MQKVGLFFGGISNEAEVSIQSARNIVKHLDYSKYRLVLVYWHTDGYFYRVRRIADIRKKSTMTKLPLSHWKKMFDIAFPITHGKYGEDGVLQALFESQRIPYCGCHVLSSSLCMDKAVFKTMIAGTTINQATFAALDFRHMDSLQQDKVIREVRRTFSLPIYCKPANSGSSVGITKVDVWKDLLRAIKKALQHDTKVVLEQGFVHHREMEVAVIGNNDLIVSDPGELVLAKEFYDYDDKYILNKTQVQIPAHLSEPLKKTIYDIAERVYRLCDCSGFARIDFFIAQNKVYLNEVNSLPGFTDISMFPMLLQKKGMTYTKIINTIISLAY